MKLSNWPCCKKGDCDGTVVQEGLLQRRVAAAMAGGGDGGGGQLRWTKPTMSGLGLGSKENPNPTCF